MEPFFLVQERLDPIDLLISPLAKIQPVFEALR